MRREERKGEENIRGETLTYEMLSGLVADMTASFPIDRAISLPSPIACCSFAWHSRAQHSIGSIVSQGFVGNNICICQHRFYSLLGFYRQAKFEGIFLPPPWLRTLKRPWQNMTVGKIFQNDNEAVLTCTGVFIYL